MAMADEWTVVPRRSSTKHHHRRPNGSCSSRRSSTLRGVCDNGLYSTTTAAARDSTTDHIHIGGARTRGPRTTESEEQQREERDQIKNDILECMLALENYLQSIKDLSDPFIDLMNMAMAASASSTLAEDQCRDTIQQHATNNADDQNQADKYANVLTLHEIVAYGIGNFATERFRAPMLQLALLLLIRRWAVIYSTKQSNLLYHPPTVCKAGSYFDASEELFQKDQSKVPIYFYDPCILPVEKELLEVVFHVHLLESNELGKLSVESMRSQYYNQQQSAENALPTMLPQPQSTICQSEFKQSLTTLFFMPHCPMQLYCNVLWAHWYDIFPHPSESQTVCDTDNDTNATSDHTNSHRSIQSNSCGTSSIVVFGNSFQTYDERTISSESRLNPTNGMLRIVPFTKEMPISISSGGRKCRGGEAIVDALRHLDTAFNDCNIIFFDRNIINTANNKHPERPEEWIASQNSRSADGELR